MFARTPTPATTPHARGGWARQGWVWLAPSTCSSATGKQLVVRLVLAKTEAERALVYEELLPLQRQDFTELLAAMDGLPVTVRLLDPPLHEFLPDLTELSVKVALEDIRGNRDSRAPPAARGGAADA